MSSGPEEDWLVEHRPHNIVKSENLRTGVQLELVYEGQKFLRPYIKSRGPQSIQKWAVYAYFPCAEASVAAEQRVFETQLDAERGMAKLAAKYSDAAYVAALQLGLNPLEHHNA